MKKIKKILSVILCVLTVLSLVSVFGFASEKAEPETAEIIVENETASGSEEISEESEEKSYAECVKENFVTGIGLFFVSPLLAPLVTTAASTALVVPLLALPVSLPLSFAAGVAAVPVGAVMALLSPVIGLIEYIAQ